MGGKRSACQPGGMTWRGMQTCYPGSVHARQEPAGLAGDATVKL
jgi:hypothetical protein